MGIICESAINELNTGKPYKDRGAGRKFDLGHGLQAMQSAFCWRMALRYIIPKNIAAYLEAVTESTGDDPACIAGTQNMTTLTHETRSG